jgi:DNA-binding response OmpR family regulator
LFCAREGFKRWICGGIIPRSSSALEKLKAHSYDLVILDIRMPDLNGFALYREIKKLDKKIKVCFLTAGEMYYGVYSDIFTSLPANCFIRKPIENEELMQRINEIIIYDNTAWIPSN